MRLDQERDFQGYADEAASFGKGSRRSSENCTISFLWEAELIKPTANVVGLVDGARFR